VSKRFEERQAALNPVLLLNLREATEFAEGCGSGLLSGHAAFQIFFDGEIDVGAQLFVEVVIELLPAEDGGAAA
jgi:hypothetical protein